MSRRAVAERPPAPGTAAPERPPQPGTAAPERPPQPGTTSPGRPLRRPGAERAASWLFAGALALGAAGPVRDNSLLTHLATGRLQVREGLPARNPFLWTSSDFPVPSWWWSALLGRAEQLFGLSGVRLVTVVFAAGLGWLLVRVSRPASHPEEPSGRLLALVLPPAVTAVLLVPFLNGRPHLAGFVCLALALVLWRERRSPWWLVAVFAAWVNLHGSWLYGLAVLVLLALAESVDARRVAGDRWRWLAAAASGLVLGGLAYPQRFRLLLLPTEQFGDEQARQAVRLYREWQPPGLGSPLGWVFAIVAVLALHGAVRGRVPSAGEPASAVPGTGEAPGVGAAASPGGPRWGTAGAVVVLAVMGLGATRLLPIAAVTLSAFAASGIEAISTVGLPRTGVRRAMAALGGVLLAAGLVRAVVPPRLDLAPYPVAEVDWLEQRGLVAEPDVVVVAPDYVGNYLEWRYGRRAEVWVDDRPSVDTFLDYERLKHLGEGWQEAFAEADPDVVLWERDEPLAAELAGDPAWVTGLTTDRYLVLCRAATVGERCD